jgi:hypothetical protein
LITVKLLNLFRTGGKYLCFDGFDLFAAVLTASGADAVGHHRGRAVGAESCSHTFVTVGSFALTALHTGSFSFRNSHFSTP